MTTLGLIRQEFVTRRKWLTEDQFLRDWSLCQLAPGINLVALVILIGRRLGGATSVLAALFGLLLPSGAVTIGLTATYQHFSHSRFVGGARLALIPGIAGIGLATVISMLLPISKKHFQASWLIWLFFGSVFAAGFLGFRLIHLSPVLVLLGAGGLGAIFNCLRPKDDEVER